MPKIKLDFGQSIEGFCLSQASQHTPPRLSHPRTAFQIKSHVVSFVSSNRDFYAQFALECTLKMCLSLMCLQSHRHTHTPTRTHTHVYIRTHISQQQGANKQTNILSLHALILHLTLNTWAPVLAAINVPGLGKRERCGDGLRDGDIRGVLWWLFLCEICLSPRQQQQLLFIIAWEMHFPNPSLLVSFLS